MILIGQACLPEEKLALAKALNWPVAQFIQRLRPSRYPSFGTVRVSESSHTYMENWIVSVPFRVDFWFIFSNHGSRRLVQKTERGLGDFFDDGEMVSVNSPAHLWCYTRTNQTKEDLERTERLINNAGDLDPS